MDSIWLIGYLCLAAAALVQSLLVALNVFEHRRRALVRLKKISYYAPSGRVLVLAPCKGHDPDLEENLPALLSQDYPDYEVTFIVEDAADPACPAIRRAMAACPQTPARLVIAGHAEDCGQKVHNLRMATADMPPEIRHLAFFDSDSRPKAHWVRAAIYKHYRPEIGATTGYRWLIPERPSLPNYLMAAINCNVMALLGRSSHHMVWGGSWAIRRATFDQLGIHKAWEQTLSDDLVASNQLRRARLKVRFDPACVLTSSVDFDWAGMFDFVTRQYRITRSYTFRWWLFALSAATIANLAWLVSMGLLAGALFAKTPLAWLPAGVLAALYGLGLYRGWAIQSLGFLHSPHNLPELRGVRRWHIWGNPIVAFVQWLGLIASAGGNYVTWRAIEYRLGSHGRVISKRVLAIPRPPISDLRPPETLKPLSRNAPTS
jgi:cellulose synthase/poly-beta-1,6-N-acetylglucosamine synthase-like glycosyltransferase